MSGSPEWKIQMPAYSQPPAIPSRILAARRLRRAEKLPASSDWELIVVVEGDPMRHIHRAVAIQIVDGLEGLVLFGARRDSAKPPPATVPTSSSDLL